MLQADEPVDAKASIEQACHPACTKQWTNYEKCKERIEGKAGATCEPWAFDYWRCIDKCVRATASSHGTECCRARRGAACGLRTCGQL